MLDEGDSVNLVVGDTGISINEEDGADVVFDEGDSVNSVVGDDTRNRYATGSYASDSDGFESGPTWHRSDGKSKGWIALSLLIVGMIWH